MTSTRPSVVMGLAVMLGGGLLVAPASSGKPKPQPCPDGTYVLQGEMFVSAPDSPAGDTIVVQGREVGIEACPLRRGRVRVTSKGTWITRRWRVCGSLYGVRLNASIAPDCRTLTGKVVAKGQQPHSFQAVRSLGQPTSTTTVPIRSSTTMTATTTSSTTTTTSSTTTTTCPPVVPTFACTEVLGFSQTGAWYLDVAHGGGGTFEPIVGDDSWQLRAYHGAGLEWQDPTFIGWTDPAALYSPCVTNSTNPDRVLLTIACLAGNVPCDPGNPSVAFWVTNVQNEIATIRAKYSNVRQIILQAVVGGPNNTVCYFNDNPADPVQSSLIHPNIDTAIAQVVAADPTGQVVAGISPEVRTCADYADSAGHLCYPGFDACGTLDARGPIGTTIGQFYAGFCPG